MHVFHSKKAFPLFGITVTQARVFDIYMIYKWPLVFPRIDVANKSRPSLESAELDTGCLSFEEGLSARRPALCIAMYCSFKYNYTPHGQDVQNLSAYSSFPSISNFDDDTYKVQPSLPFVIEILVLTQTLDASSILKLTILAGYSRYIPILQHSYVQIATFNILHSTFSTTSIWADSVSSLYG